MIAWEVGRTHHPRFRQRQALREAGSTGPRGLRGRPFHCLSSTSLSFLPCSTAPPKVSPQRPPSLQETGEHGEAARAGGGSNPQDHRTLGAACLQLPPGPLQGPCTRTFPGVPAATSGDLGPLCCVVLPARSWLSATLRGGGGLTPPRPPPWTPAPQPGGHARTAVRLCPQQCSCAKELAPSQHAVLDLTNLPTKLNRGGRS